MTAAEGGRTALSCFIRAGEPRADIVHSGVSAGDLNSLFLLFEIIFCCFYIFYSRKEQRFILPLLIIMSSFGVSCFAYFSLTRIFG